MLEAVIVYAAFGSAFAVVMNLLIALDGDDWPLKKVIPLSFVMAAAWPYGLYRFCFHIFVPENETEGSDDA